VRRALLLVFAQRIHSLITLLSTARFSTADERYRTFVNG